MTADLRRGIVEVTTLADNSTHGHASTQPELSGDGVETGAGITVYVGGEPVTAVPWVYVNGEFKQASVKIYRDGAFV